MPIMFKTKYEARDAGYSVRPTPKGWSVFHHDQEIGAHNKSERGAWGIIVGDPPPPESKPQTACSFKGCKRPGKCRGMCLPHYHYMYRSGTLATKKQWRPDIDGVDTSKPGCIAVGCESDRQKRGFCKNHRDTVRNCGREDLLLPMQRPAKRRQ